MSMQNSVKSLAFPKIRREVDADNIPYFAVSVKTIGKVIRDHYVTYPDDESTENITARTKILPDSFRMENGGDVKNIVGIPYELDNSYKVLVFSSSSFLPGQSLPQKTEHRIRFSEVVMMLQTNEMTREYVTTAEGEEMFPDSTLLVEEWGAGSFVYIPLNLPDM